ncbi:MAG: acyl-CoA dehydrogenase family protein [Novosphingobium sp.]|nr:acyl-CoA dehydrogenase family protein [Novosphingobium sp.]
MAILTEEQTMLRDMAQEWVRHEQPVTAFRRLRDSGTKQGFDPEVFKAVAQMGWTGVIVPEAYGGTGLGYLSLGLILEEAGRNLVATPLAASALGAASALVLGGSEAQKQQWLPGIVSGDVVGALAIDDTSRHDPGNIATTATEAENGWTLDGTKMFVAEGDGANLFIVAARTERGVGLFLVPGDAAGISRSHRAVVDSRSHAEIRFDATPVGHEALIGEDDGSQLDRLLDHVRVGAAAELLGLAEQAFETTLAYLKTRVQFNQTLASFQALQHRCAQLFTQIELVRSAVESALQALDQQRPNVPQAASLAKAAASELSHQATREMIQLHGGIGMTDEHDAGFYLKRSRMLEAQWGNAAFHRNRFASLSGF